ncbi:hypothetical protein BJ508DRAFT_155624 [Ascobolus immersus RN42]|uniref:BTB domain-containing protein n=1 Tax=Ascobolus immersus RN42 TaxID=1160509 RepID=A0A3N4HZ90_ASCIM|nr:hypothetical protein BJ508DRAFT_155624 [Ascobolus immersus RN42]
MATAMICPDCKEDNQNQVRCCWCSQHFICSSTVSYCSRRCNTCAQRDKEKKLDIDLTAQDGIHYSSIFLSKTIEVVLSPPNAKAPVRYHLHIDKLRQSADYFALLFAFNGKETTDNKITLSENVDDPEAFKFFVQYVYCSDYLIPEAYEPYSALLHAMVYVLAERLQALKLRALATKKLGDYLGKGTPTDSIVIKMVRAVYEGTCLYTTSPIKQGDEKDVNEEKDKSVRDETSAADGRESDNEVVAVTDASETLDFDEDPDSDSEIKPVNPLRTLVTRYAASKLDRLRNQPKFRVLLKEFPEFAEDIMSEVKNGQFTA